MTVVEAVVVVCTIPVSLTICGILLLVEGNQVIEGEAVMASHKVDTPVWIQDGVFEYRGTVSTVTIDVEPLNPQDLSSGFIVRVYLDE